MKVICRSLAVTVLSAMLAAGCSPTSDGGNPIDGIIDGGQDTQPQDGQQLDPILEGTAGASAVDMTDIDNDGDMDFVSVSSENQPVQLHLLDSDGNFDLLSIAGGGPLAIMTDVETADFNGDGKQDIAILANDSGFAPPPGIAKFSALVLLIQGANPLDFSDWTHVEPLPECYVGEPPAHCAFVFVSNEVGAVDMTVADFDGDGYPDVAVGSNEPGSPPPTFTYVLMNPGPAGVTNSTMWTRVVADRDANNFMQLEAVDLDRDGDQDIVAAASTSKTYNIRWLQNNGSGLYWGFREVGEQMGGGNCIAVGDIDGDDNADVAVASNVDTLVQWFQNPGPLALAPGLPHVPWYVYNVGFVNQIELTGGSAAATINHMYLLDSDVDGESEIFLTADGIAFEYQRSASGVTQPWTGTAVFATNPAGVIGWIGFYNYGGTAAPDMVIPVDRTGLTQDGFYLFTR